VVIGSGILNSLGIRPSRDIDVVTTAGKYKELSRDNLFKKEQRHGREILVGGVFEIRTDWPVIGKTWEYDDLLNQSTIIDCVRYITIDFLLNAKQHWIADGYGRPKDLADVALMERYLANL
jgi:hypothetical protein